MFIMPSLQSLRQRNNKFSPTWRMTTQLPAFAVGMALMYFLLLLVGFGGSPVVPPAQQQLSEEPAWITAPRATKPGAQCDPLLLCAWSLDNLRTQVVSLTLFHRVIGAGNIANNNNLDSLPTVQQSIQLGRSSNPILTDAQYDELNKWYEASDSTFFQKTGIHHLDLPKEIHVIPMGGEAYFRRSVRDADLILDGFLRNNENDNDTGFLPQPGQAWLDFGGSHGRIAQIMSAAFPDTTWYVSDPIESTIAWARVQFKDRLNLQFQVMGQQPPLSMYDDDKFTGIYALSIWSHYSEQAALLWFAEMHRILAPKGRLWFSTHGHQALNFASLPAAAVHLHRAAMMKELYTVGHYYYPMFSQVGDWGVSDEHDGSWWGFGAFTAEWLAAKVLNTPGAAWRLEYYGPGANENHQDVYVLTKL